MRRRGGGEIGKRGGESSSRRRGGEGLRLVGSPLALGSTARRRGGGASSAAAAIANWTTSDRIGRAEEVGEEWVRAGAAGQQTRVRGAWEELHR